MFKKLKDHLVPHKGNGHNPKLFAAEVVGELLLIIMLFQVVFVAHTAVVKNSDFLAAVLPTVLVTMTNVDRVEAGVSELQSDALLAKAAQAKADDMAAKGYFAHRDPQGRDPWYWFDKVGYVYSYAGENLAVDFSESVEVEEAWMKSPAHKANIMKDKFTKVGIGVAQGMYEGRETTFVVQFFAKPASLAPVAITAPVVPAPELLIVSAQPATQALAPIKVAVVEPEVFIAAEEAVTVGDGQVLGEAFIPIATTSEMVLLVDTVSQEVQSLPIEDVSATGTLKEKFIELASSPSQWYLPILLTLFVLLGLSLATSLYIHMGKREVEGIALAMVVLVLLAGLVHFNFGNSSTSAVVPTDGQYASVSTVFEDGFYFQ